MKVKKIIVFFVLVLITGCSFNGNLRKDQTKLTGMYVYYADAAILFLCDSEEKVFVRGGEGNIELERRYLSARKEPMDKVYVEIGGHYEMAEKMDGEGLEEVFLVTDVYEVDPERECF